MLLPKTDGSVEVTPVASYKTFSSGTDCDYPTVRSEQLSKLARKQQRREGSFPYLQVGVPSALFLVFLIVCLLSFATVERNHGTLLTIKPDEAIDDALADLSKGFGVSLKSQSSLTVNRPNDYNADAYSQVALDEFHSRFKGLFALLNTLLRRMKSEDDVDKMYFKYMPQLAAAIDSEAFIPLANGSELIVEGLALGFGTEFQVLCAKNLLVNAGGGGGMALRSVVADTRELVSAAAIEDYRFARVPTDGGLGAGVQLIKGKKITANSKISEKKQVSVSATDCTSQTDNIQMDDGADVSGYVDFLSTTQMSAWECSNLKMSGIGSGTLKFNNGFEVSLQLSFTN